MLNETTASHLLETTNRAFEQIKSQYPDCEFASSLDDLRNYRVQLIADKSRRQLGHMKMEFQIQEQNQEIEELRLVNLQYQATIKRVTSKNREIQFENEQLIEKCNRTEQDSKKNLKRVLDSNENIDINANIKRIPNQDEFAKQSDANEKRDDLVAKLRSHNANLLKEKDELIRKGEKFKAAYTEFKRSYEDLRTKYEEVCSEKKAELMKDPRITKFISNEKDLRIQELNKLNAELQERLQKQAEALTAASGPDLSTVKQERDTELFDQTQQTSVRASFNETEKDKKIKEQDARIKKMEDSKNILETSLRNKTIELENMKSKHSQYSRDRLQTDSQSDRTRISDLEKEYKSLKDRYEKELKSATERLEREQQCISNLRQELENQKTESRNQNELFVKLKNSHESKITALKSELDKKQQKAGESSKASEELNRLKSDLTSRDRELEKYKTLYEKTNSDAQRKQDLINDLTRSNNDYQSKYNMSVDLINLLKEKLATNEQLLASQNLLLQAQQKPQQQQHPASAFVPISRAMNQSPSFGSIHMMNNSLSRSNSNSPLISQQRAGLTQSNLAQQQQQQQQQQQPNQQNINSMNSQSSAFLPQQPQHANGKPGQGATGLGMQAIPLGYHSLNQQGQSVRSPMGNVQNLSSASLANRKEKSPPSSNDPAKK